MFCLFLKKKKSKIENGTALINLYLLFCDHTSLIVRNITFSLFILGKC